MSQNGPYPGQGWPAGGPPGAGEPYAAPADPWGAADPPDPSWGARPHSVPPDPPVYDPPAYDPAAFGPPQPAYPAAPLNTPPPWQQPPPPPRRRRNAPIVALVVVLGLLICGGLGTTAYLVSRTDKPSVGATGESAAPSGPPTRGAAVPDPATSQDARFVGKGQCVRNQGDADDSPDLKIVPCASGTYEVLKRVDGRTTGEPDAESKCSKVANYTKWYFYDSELDSLDFVLCLREYPAK
ncbi:LppU/SCO3897 family protein [Symbioplanes lichenis]|uniref:LppU/SCO3897 family protein n=1 Tax=Symbioplanes lichenis TaxID=1629072 RepID=UPI00273A457E|nr:hypothetical protein [Actinoplanes lichenis]